MGIVSISRNLLGFKSKSRLLFSNFRILSSVASSFGDEFQVSTLRTLLRDLNPNKENNLKFIIQYHRDDSDYYSLFSLRNSSENKLDNIRYPLSGHGHTLSASTNGLCLLVYHKGAIPSEVIWNPTTNEVKTLPRSDSSCPHYPTKNYTYFNPYGFAFDPTTQDYKVIKFLNYTYCKYRSNWYVLVQLYSLKHNSWKDIDCPPYLGSPCDMLRVCINGIYYWATTPRQSIEVRIISFDFTTEKFTRIPLPKTKTKLQSICNFKLVEFDRSLAVLVHENFADKKREKKPFVGEIWVWNGSESWNKVSTIEVPAVVGWVIGLFEND